MVPRLRSLGLISALIFSCVVFLDGCCVIGSSSGTAGRSLPCQTAETGSAAAPPHPASPRERPTLLLYCGAGIRKPVEDVNRAFQQETGIRVEPTFTGSGCLLAQIEVADKGDLYMPGEKWYMQQAVQRGKVSESLTVAQFVPVIMVQRGNPHGIRSVVDLTRPGIRIGVGEPKACAIGHFTEVVIDELKVPREAFRRNVVAHFATAPELGNAVKIKSVDACIQWDSIAALYLDDADVVAFPVTEKTSTPIEIGLLKTSKHADAARAYMQFITGPRGRAIFKKHHFTLDLAHPTFPPDGRLGG